MPGCGRLGLDAGDCAGFDGRNDFAQCGERHRPPSRRWPVGWQKDLEPRHCRSLSTPTNATLWPAAVPKTWETRSTPWNRVVSEYELDDFAADELLTQACQATDRAEELAAHVARDGAIVRTATGIKAHPAIREELSCRGFIVRTRSLD